MDIIRFYDFMYTFKKAEVRYNFLYQNWEFGKFLYNEESTKSLMKANNNEILCTTTKLIIDINKNNIFV